MRLRFAPSPTGQLHVGNARTALFNWLLARRAGGEFILRIEDTDAERSTRDSEEGIIRDLRWMGLEWDEGPDVGGPLGPYRQSERLHLYTSYGNELLAAGRAYYCFCSAARLEAERQAAVAAGRPPHYSGRCRAIDPADARARVAAGQAAALRFAVPESGGVTFHDLVRGPLSFGMEVIGDPIILRSDGRPAYNFAVVVDDAAMRVTHVIRGEDHISNTPRQVLLYDALGFTPPEFAHLALVMGPDHTPLSKRHGATAVAEFRARGYLPEALVNYLALIGWSPGGGEELLPIGELVRRFSLDDVGTSSGVFDEEKLAWVNRHYLRGAAPGRLAAELTPFLVREGIATGASPAAAEYVESLVPIIAGAVDRLSDAPGRLRFIFAFDAAASLGRDEVRAVVEEAGARDVILALADELARAPRLDREGFRAAAARVRQRTGLKGRALFHPIRVALTGEAAGPELDLAVPAIDRGAELPPSAGVATIVGCRERAAAFASCL
jgi:glutamyl-tRNA synthetase/nondiscriminating glutamyl-tRNA synthetase